MFGLILWSQDIIKQLLSGAISGTGQTSSFNKVTSNLTQGPIMSIMSHVNVTSEIISNPALIRWHGFALPYDFCTICSL